MVKDYRLGVLEIFYYYLEWANIQLDPYGIRGYFVHRDEIVHSGHHDAFHVKYPVPNVNLLHGLAILDHPETVYQVLVVENATGHNDNRAAVQNDHYCVHRGHDDFYHFDNHD